MKKEKRFTYDGIGFTRSDFESFEHPFDMSGVSDKTMGDMAAMVFNRMSSKKDKIDYYKANKDIKPNDEIVRYVQEDLESTMEIVAILAGIPYKEDVSVEHQGEEDVSDVA